MSKTGINIFAAIICIMFLTACGLSEENLGRITDAQNELSLQKEAAEELYTRLTVETFSDTLSAYSSKYDEIMGLDLEKVKDKEVDELVPSIEELTSSYVALSEKMTAELEAEEAAAAEAAKHIEAQCRLENKTGLELTSVIFKDVTAGTATGNYLTDGYILSNGRILEGLILPIYTDSKGWSLLLTDSEGTEYEYSLDLSDPAAAAEKGLSITVSEPETGAEVSFLR